MLIRLVGAMLLAASATGVAAEPVPRLPHRLNVPTFIIAADPVVASELQTWTSLLQNDFAALVGGGLAPLADAGRISFSGQKLASAPTPDTIANRWRQLNAIQIITAIGSRQGGATVLEGSVYLGDLSGGTPPVLLPPTVDAASYQTSRDIVKAATLYALAMDAGSYLPAACRLLHQAGQTRDDIARRHGSIGSLGAAIDKRRIDLKCVIVR